MKPLTVRSSAAILPVVPGSTSLGSSLRRKTDSLSPYNITSLNAPMRRALNRERTNVGRTAYSERVKSILLASTSTVVADILAADLIKTEQGTNHDEISWNDVAVHASRILSASDNVVFVTTADMMGARDSIDHAESNGYKVVTVPDSIRHALSGLNDLDGNPVRSLSVYEQQLSESFKFEFVEPTELDPHEQLVFAARDQIAKLADGFPRSVHGIRVSATMRPDSASGSGVVGLWQPGDGQIIVKRSELCSIPRFAGVLLHEITHACTGYGDVSREFETALTILLGSIAARAVSPT